MSDDLKNTGKQDDTRINAHEPWELRSWAEKLGITELQLIKAVREVGPMVEDVKKYLGK